MIGRVSIKKNRFLSTFPGINFLHSEQTMRNCDTNKYFFLLSLKSLSVGQQFVYVTRTTYSAYFIFRERGLVIIDLLEFMIEIKRTIHAPLCTEPFALRHKLKSCTVPFLYRSDVTFQRMLYRP